MNQNELFEKLRKLKALAEDAANTNEAEAALLAFQRLLAKNGLSEADVALSDEKQTSEKVDESVVHSGKRVPQWIDMIHTTIAGHFRCVGILHRDKLHGITHLQFFGHTTDVLIASQAFQSAIAAAHRLCAEQELKAIEDSVLDGCDDDFNKNNYLIGFAMGLDRAYHHAKANDKSLALIIQTPEDVIAAANELTGGRTQKARPLNPLIFGASFCIGFDDGEAVGSGDRLRKGATA